MFSRLVDRNVWSWIHRQVHIGSIELGDTQKENSEDTSRHILLLDYCYFVYIVLNHYKIEIRELLHKDTLQEDLDFAWMFALLSSFSVFYLIAARDLFSLSYPHGSSFKYGHCHSMDVDMHCWYIADSLVVVPVLIGHVDLIVWHTSRVARFGHQIRAVAHEVILPLIKGCVMRITRGNAGGGACGWKPAHSWISYKKYKPQGLRLINWSPSQSER